MPEPLFSIVLPTYNRARFLPRSIGSVEAQSCTDWELLVMDDASTDDTPELMQGYADPRIRYIRHEQNMERSANRNAGIERAKGRFICLLDSDDAWRPEHLAVMKQAIEANSHKDALYFTGYVWHFPDGRNQEVNLPAVEGSRVEYVIRHQPATPALCMARQITAKHRYNTSLSINEDTELNARIAADYPLIKIPAYTVDVYVHDDNTLNTEKDTAGKELMAKKMIFANPVLKEHISSRFKYETLRGLRHRRINEHLAAGKYGKMRLLILGFLLRYPFHRHNKSKMVMLLYSLIGGKFIKKLKKDA